MTTNPTPSAEEVLAQFGHAIELLIAYSHRPVGGTVFINGRPPQGMTIILAPGQPFKFDVQYDDQWHNIIAETSAGTTTWQIEHGDGTVVPDAATLTDLPSTDEHGSGLVTAPAGTTDLFLHAILTRPDGSTLDLRNTDPIQIQTGPAFIGTVTVSPVAATP